jgi:hypothetical protein
MRAIVHNTAHNTARGAALVCIAIAFAGADAHDDVMEVVTSMAGALTEVNLPKFMAAFSKDMPEYGTIESNVGAMMNNADVSSSIQPLTEEGDDRARQVDLDWFIEVRSLEQDGPLVRRREVVHCELRKDKKQWKIVALKPLDFFAPPNLGK